MTRETLRDFVIDEFLPGQDPRDLADDQPLLSAGIIDSVGTMRLVLFLEDRFGITIETEDILAGRLDTLGRLCALVAARRQHPAPTEPGR